MADLKEATGNIDFASGEFSLGYRAEVTLVWIDPQVLERRNFMFAVSSTLTIAGIIFFVYLLPPSLRRLNRACEKY